MQLLMFVTTLFFIAAAFFTVIAYLQGWLQPGSRFLAWLDPSPGDVAFVFFAACIVYGLIFSSVMESETAKKCIEARMQWVNDDCIPVRK